MSNKGNKPAVVIENNGKRNILKKVVRESSSEKVTIQLRTSGGKYLTETFLIRKIGRQLSFPYSVIFLLQTAKHAQILPEHFSPICMALC